MEAFVGTLIIGVIVLFAATMVLLQDVHDLKVDAVERGYALYCPHNGEFAWKGECDND